MSVHERRVTSADEGTDWLYVDPKDGSQHRVEIDVVPDKAHKIRVQHLDRDMRGKSEWVPIGRAKVPWELRDAYQATVDLWRAAEQHRPPTSHGEAAVLLFDSLVHPGVAEIYYNGAAGILVVRNVDELLKISRLTAEELRSHPDSFEDDGVLHVPWPTTLNVLKALCQRRPRPALELLAQRRADDDAWKQQIARDGDPWWVQGAREGDRYAKRLRRWGEIEEESIAFLHWLVDADSPSLADDFLRLREMYLDFVNIVPEAVSRIRMIPAKISQDMALRLQELADRPLPASAGLLGAEKRAPD
ncbi:hypothetical protein [Microbacterium sp. 3J1]|uniref:hypothetical protein n=1 Tax=Microbacterium sp. 3J1 TaxID=861269 RepID=UPI000AA5AD71|nr:hypothetical protein [Microbacterium sp. 3J1]